MLIYFVAHVAETFPGNVFFHFFGFQLDRKGRHVWKLSAKIWKTFQNFTETFPLPSSHRWRSIFFFFLSEVECQTTCSVLEQLKHKTVWLFCHLKTKKKISVWDNNKKQQKNHKKTAKKSKLLFDHHELSVVLQVCNLWAGVEGVGSCGHKPVGAGERRGGVTHQL